MSLHSYMVSYELARQDPPFSALIMAAMRKADSQNSILLHHAFPEIWNELQARYEAPDGRIGTEATAEVPVQVEITMGERLIDPDCRDGKHTSCLGDPCECTCHAPGPVTVEVPPAIAEKIEELRQREEELFMLPNPDHVQGEPIITAAGQAELQRRFHPDVEVPEDEL